MRVCRGALKKKGKTGRILTQAKSTSFSRLIRGMPRQVRRVHVLTNPFSRPARAALPHISPSCLSLSPLIFAVRSLRVETSESLASRAARYISDRPRSSRDRVLFSNFVDRREPVDALQEKHFPCPARSTLSSRITFQKEGAQRRHIRGFWTRREHESVLLFHPKICMVPSSRRENRQKGSRFA